MHTRTEAWVGEAYTGEAEALLRWAERARSPFLWSDQSIIGLRLKGPKPTKPEPHMLQAGIGVAPAAL